MYIQDWLYNIRTTWNWTYIVPLSFAIIVLSFTTTAMTIAVVIISKRNTKKITEGLDKVVTALQGISSRLNDNTSALDINTKELRDELEEGRKHTSELTDKLELNRQAIEKNMASLDDIRKIFSWWKWR